MNAAPVKAKMDREVEGAPEAVYGAVFRTGLGLRVGVCNLGALGQHGENRELTPSQAATSLRSVTDALSRSLVAIQERAKAGTLEAPFLAHTAPIRLQLSSDAETVAQLGPLAIAPESSRDFGSASLDVRTHAISNRVPLNQATQFVFDQSDVLVVFRTGALLESPASARIHQALQNGALVIQIPRATRPIKFFAGDADEELFQEDLLASTLSTLLAYPPQVLGDTANSGGSWLESSNKLRMRRSKPRRVVFEETDPVAGFSLYVDKAGSLWTRALRLNHQIWRAAYSLGKPRWLAPFFDGDSAARGVDKPSSSHPSAETVAEQLRANLPFTCAERLAQHYAGVHAFVVILTSCAVALSGCLLLSGQLRGWVTALLFGLAPLAGAALAHAYARRSAWKEKAQDYRLLAEEFRLQEALEPQRLPSTPLESWARRVVHARRRYPDWDPARPSTVEFVGVQTQAQFSQVQQSALTHSRRLHGLANCVMRKLATALFAGALALASACFWGHQTGLLAALASGCALALSLIRWRLELHRIPAGRATAKS